MASLVFSAVKAAAALAAGALLIGCMGTKREAPVSRIDHVILGVADLDRGMSRFEEMTGAAAPYGGEHPGVGTHNALASLGDGVYLEIIAANPGETLADRWSVLAELEELTPVGWAISVDDLDAAREALREAGLEAGPPAPGSRERPDGALLQWRTAAIVNPRMSPGPFLIEWGPNAAHPSTTEPTGCRLESLTVLSPSPADAARLVETLGLAVDVKDAADWSLAFVLQCPNGRMEFGKR